MNDSQGHYLLQIIIFSVIVGLCSLFGYGCRSCNKACKESSERRHRHQQRSSVVYIDKTNDNGYQL